MLSKIPFSRIQRLAKEFSWVVLGQALAAIGGIVGVRFLTHALTPTSYGELALGMTVATLNQQMILGPLSAGFMRFFAPAQEANELPAYIRSVWSLLLKGTAVVLTIAALCSLGVWIAGQTMWLGIVIVSFVFSLISGYNSILDGIQNAARQRIVVAWHQGIAQWLRFGSAIGLISLLGATSSVAMFGYVLASVVVFGSQIFFSHQKIMTDIHQTKQKGDFSGWQKQILTYSLPFSMWAPFSWAQMSSDRWALQLFSTTKDVGMYAVLYQIGYYPIMILSTLMVQLVTPILFSRAGDGTDSARMIITHRLNQQLVIASLFLTFGATFFALFFHQQIFLLLTAPEYRSTSYLLPLIVLSGGLFAMGQTATLSLLSDTNTKKLLLPKITTALLGVALNIFGAHMYGITGVVSASVCFSLCYCIWILVAYYRVNYNEIN